MKITNIVISNNELKESKDSEPLLFADMERKVVITNCGDFYYDYEIPFDDFIRFAKFLEGNL